MKKIAHAYIKWVTACNKGLFYLAAALMALIVPVMLYEVTSRYVFNAPTTWGMELALLMFGPYFLFGGPYLLHVKGHVNLDLLHQRVPASVAKVLDVINLTIIMTFCVILFSYALPLAVQSFGFRETSFSAWNPPVWHIKFTVPIAVFMLGAQGLAELIRIFLGGNDKETVS